MIANKFDFIAFRVDGEPVPKGRPRVTRSGHVYTPKETREYEDLIIRTYEDKFGPTMFTDDPRQKLRLHVRVESKRAWRFDGDNVLKTVGDALNNLAYPDDRQVFSESVDKWEHVAAGHEGITIILSLLDAPEDVTPCATRR